MKATKSVLLSLAVALMLNLGQAVQSQSMVDMWWLKYPGTLCENSKCFDSTMNSDDYKGKVVFVKGYMKNCRVCRGSIGNYVEGSNQIMKDHSDVRFIEIDSRATDFNKKYNLKHIPAYLAFCNQKLQTLSI